MQPSALPTITTTDAVLREAARLLTDGARSIERAWEKHGKETTREKAQHHREIARRLLLIADREAPPPHG